MRVGYTGRTDRTKRQAADTVVSAPSKDQRTGVSTGVERRRETVGLTQRTDRGSGAVNADDDLFLPVCVTMGFLSVPAVSLRMGRIVAVKQGRRS